MIPKKPISGEAVRELLGNLHGTDLVPSLERYRQRQGGGGKRERILTDIRHAYLSERLCLVLGAGVSLDVGLPSWHLLLQKLLAKAIAQEAVDPAASRVVAQLFDGVIGPNPLVSARWLTNWFREHSRTGRTFEDAVREALYEDLEEDSSAMWGEIVKLCASPGRRANLDSVITFNYDDLLERNLSRLELDIPFASIFELGQHPGPNDLPIYHVHGFLPRDPGLPASPAITLGDDSYHEQYTDSYSWSNLIQLAKYSEKRCLFLGVSFSDPNLRRLLDIARNLRGNKGHRHFVVKKRPDRAYVRDQVAGVVERDAGPADAPELGLAECVDLLVDLVIEFETMDAESFGVEAVWVDTYEEIPGVLAEVRA